MERAYDCVNRAAMNGHLQLVTWLSSSRVWNPSIDYRDRWAGTTTAAMDNAAAGGHLKVKKFKIWVLTRVLFRLYVTFFFSVFVLYFCR